MTANFLYYGNYSLSKLSRQQKRLLLHHEDIHTLQSQLQIDNLEFQLLICLVNTIS